MSALRAESPGELRAGASKISITPSNLAGLNPMGNRTFDGVLDDLYLRTLVVSDGVSEAAVVSVDLIEVGDTRPMRMRIENELGIDADHVFIAASHSHNAPRFGRVSPGALAHEGGQDSDRYTAWVSDRMIDALREARESLVSARLGFAVGHVDVNVNRDEFIGGRWLLGQDEQGSSDKALRTVVIEGLNAEPIAVVVNYAVHSTATLWSGMVSADLAGAAARHIERELPGVVAMWTCGALGDQAPRVSLGEATGDVERDRRYACQAAEAQGVMVGAEAVRLIRQPKDHTPGARVHAAQRVTLLPTRRGVDQPATMSQAPVDVVPLTLSVLMIGPIVLAGVGGEVTARVALDVLRESPAPHTLLTSLVNDRIGYLPDDEAYDRETFEAKGSPVARGHGARAITEGLASLIGSMVGS